MRTPRTARAAYTTQLPKTWPSRAKAALTHVIAAAHLALVHSKAWCGDSPLRRVKLTARVVELETEVALITTELRLKDARMARVPAQRRPHYTPIERLDISCLRAARAWSAAQTARRFQLTAQTVQDWTKRRDEGGDDALLQTKAPVNTFPAFVSNVVTRLHQLAPHIGKVKVAQTLARAGLHISASTIARMKKKPRGPKGGAPNDDGTKVDPQMSADDAAADIKDASTSLMVAPAPNHTWIVDLTVVPTRAGFWVPWLPYAITQLIPFA